MQIMHTHTHASLFEYLLALTMKPCKIELNQTAKTSSQIKILFAPYQLACVCVILGAR